ncbi:Hypothetical predicted protein, partial [Marmota monax]
VQKSLLLLLLLPPDLGMAGSGSQEVLSDGPAATWECSHCWAGHLSSTQMFTDTSWCPWEPQGFAESTIGQQDDLRHPALPPNIISTFAGASKLLCKRNDLNVM